jgi:hypothetical protein
MQVSGQLHASAAPTPTHPPRGKEKKTACVYRLRGPTSDDPPPSPNIPQWSHKLHAQPGFEMHSDSSELKLWISENVIGQLIASPPTSSLSSPWPIWRSCFIVWIYWCTRYYKELFSASNFIRAVVLSHAALCLPLMHITEVARQYLYSLQQHY